MSASLTVNNAPEGGKSAGHSFARLFFWNVRRELWDTRSVFIAPLAAAGLLILALLLLVVNLRHQGGMPAEANFGGNVKGLWIAYLIPAGPVLGVSMIVALTYCLGALHNERRDRSILFWKSLPVSDLVTVLSKASLPLAVIPLVAFAVAVMTQLLTFAIMFAAVALLGTSAHVMWGGMPLGQATIGTVWAATPVVYLTFGMLYGLVATTLWYAPVYAWLLLVGGWARRMTFLWAIAPPIGLMIFERVAFGTSYLTALLDDRLNGAMPLAFRDGAGGSPPLLTPGVFFTAPGLWAGLGFAALFLTAAILLRRYRQPI